VQFSGGKQFFYFRYADFTRRCHHQVEVSGRAHTFRHSFAVHYLNCGGSIFALQRLLGHQNITTTLHYLKYASLPEGKQISVLDEMP
jgi:site-specific recombinase XerD